MAKIYQLPPKIEDIVRKNPQEISKKLNQSSDCGCPLQGYQDSRAGRGWSSSLDFPSNPRKGCSALRDYICYLERPSLRGHKQGRVYHSKVSCKEECPVYQRVEELLGQ